MNDRRHDIGLFRYSLVREAADKRLRKSERGELVRLLALRDHVTPEGKHVRVGRSTLDRWIRDWHKGGFEALVPSPRTAVSRTSAELLDLAVSLRREAPRRTAAQIATIITAKHESGPSERTVQRHLARRNMPRGGTPPRVVYGRFEAEHPNDRWTGDESLNNWRKKSLNSYNDFALTQPSRPSVPARAAPEFPPDTRIMGARAPTKESRWGTNRHAGSTRPSSSGMRIAGPGTYRSSFGGGRSLSKA